MQYFVRQIFINDIDAAGDEAEQDYASEDYDVACKAYAERLGEIKDDLPKSVRKLLDDPTWADASKLRYVNDHFYIEPCEELTFLLEAGKSMFVVRYTVEEPPVVEAPEEEDKPYFEAKDSLEIIEEEWDLDGKQAVHRILLNNGFVVTFRPKDFHWWKTQVEAHG